jgi:SnoaL-like domain
MNDDKAIRNLLAAYALTLDVEDLDACLALFTDDGEFEVYGKTLSRERIRKMFMRAPKGMHMTGAALIDVRGETATAQSQVLFVDSSTHQIRPALYDDELMSVHGQWRFRRRRCQFLTAAGLSDSPQGSE